MRFFGINMAAYLIVDVDDLVVQFKNKGISMDFQELAVGLRGGAALAAGLASADKLRAVAVADWDAYARENSGRGAADPQFVLRAAGYDVFNVPNRNSLADALIIHYFAFDPDPVNELIIATTSTDLIPLVRRVKTTASARIRVWGTRDVLEGTEFADEVIFQPFESLLGIQTKNVSVYIDFENIAISLNEQGFTVNLDHLIDRFVTQAKAHGQVVGMSAYAPWGQRGTLPPLVDGAGREIAEEAPSRLMLANIEPVFNLPGKNSADIRIARDVLAHSGYEASDVYILASGDRDFNDVLNALVTRGKQVIVWGVRGSTSRQLEKNPGITVEYIEDFTSLQTHSSYGSSVAEAQAPAENFTPSQWSSLVVQFDRLADEREVNVLTETALIDQLRGVGAVVSQERGHDLVSQATALGLLKPVSANGRVTLSASHPTVERTRIIRDRIVLRVKNTLRVRGWEYVNYGFLLKGLSMDHELDGPGLNVNDQWRSHWIDALVREQILARELVPHRHNPDDLVPVIKMRDDYDPQIMGDEGDMVLVDREERTWSKVSLQELIEQELETAEMVYRIVVSVEQFTSFRGFAWCPLGSLHRRLRNYDQSMSFQRAVEYLMEHNAATVDEYENPQSNYNTKGISINEDNGISASILRERNDFIKLLLNLYEQNMLISETNVRRIVGESSWNLSLWFSIMETENVLNPIPSRKGQFSLFRTHHTVNLVAEATGRKREE